jgi:hypothetical protein
MTKGGSIDLYQGRQIGWTEETVAPRRYPGFPVELVGVGEVHAAFLTESRTRGRG